MKSDATTASSSSSSVAVAWLVVILKTSSNIVRKDRKLHYNNDEDIVFDYFSLIKNKDIERLMNLFSPDAIVYEPFSKLREGVSGKQAIESFLRIVIMAIDELQYCIVIENISDIKNRSNVDCNHNHENKNNCSSCFSMKDVNALVTYVHSFFVPPRKGNGDRKLPIYAQ